MLQYLPAVNASLNAITFALIVAGLTAINRGNEQLHKRLMLSAVGTSALFLVSYLIYHFNVGSTKFQREGTIRSVYLVILLSHTILATVQVPLIIMTVIHGLKDRRAKHKKLARITAPIWMYVSISGVIIYFMLYHM